MRCPSHNNRFMRATLDRVEITTADKCIRRPALNRVPDAAADCAVVPGIAVLRATRNHCGLSANAVVVASAQHAVNAGALVRRTTADGRLMSSRADGVVHTPCDH